MDMQLVRGNRKHITSIGWENGMLQVEFQGGRRYVFGGVPEEVKDKLLRSPFPGKLFQLVVRGKYVSERVDTPPSKPITPYPIDWPNLPF